MAMLMQQLRARFHPLLATQARQRMMALSLTGLLFGLFTTSFDVVMPLWVTQDLGYSASQWAQLRGLRMLGILTGVIFLGALSDRFGQRLLGALSMVGVGVLMLVLKLGAPERIWLLMPLLGALISTAFVNLSALTQMVSARRQGVANTIYRSIAAAAGIAAPVLATGLAARWQGYPSLFPAFVALLLASAFALMLYPGEAAPSPLGRLGDEVRHLWEGYRAALRERHLMAFILLSQFWGNLLGGVGAFAAIRFTLELSRSDQQFGALSAAAGALAFAATAASGLFLDRVSLRNFYVVTALLSSLCSIVMGLGDNYLLSALGFILIVPILNLKLGPDCMWVSRTAGASSQAAAFSVHKVISATLVALAMYAMGYLEQWIGIRAILLYGGIAGAVTGLAFLLLPEPPPPRPAGGGG